MRAPPRRVSAPGPSCPRAAARRSLVRRLGRGSSGRRCRTERGRHSRARLGRCAEPPRERYLRPATSPRANVRLGPRADAARRLAAVTAVRARPPGLRNYSRHSRWFVPFAVPVSRRGVERDPQCHGTRVRLHGTGAHRERVPSVLGGIRDPRFLAHATVSDRDRAVSTHPVPGYAAPDSARVACRLRGHGLGGVARTNTGALGKDRERGSNQTHAPGAASALIPRSIYLVGYAARPGPEDDRPDADSGCPKPIPG